MDCRELNLTLLDLIDDRVTIDIVNKYSPAMPLLPLAGMVGTLINVTEQHAPEDTNEQTALTIRVAPDGSTADSFLTVWKPAFRPPTGNSTTKRMFSTSSGIRFSPS